MPSKTLRELLRQAATRLAPNDAADLEAELLLCHALGTSRSFLFAHPEFRPEPETQARFERLVQERGAGRPVAHLLGAREFWSLRLEVNEHTLIPRPETECLVDAALARIAGERELRVADLGTGSGAIALAIASERPLAQVVATDRSPEALGVAQRNAEALGLAARVAFHQGDWCAALGDARFDAIVSNPPYIRVDDPHLRAGDLRFEPITALASGADGLDAIRRIIGAAPTHLVPGGWLLLEHGMQQGAAVRDLLSAAGLVDVATVQDLEARDRVTLGRADAGHSLGAGQDAER